MVEFKLEVNESIAIRWMQEAIASGKGVEEWLIERANQVNTLSNIHNNAIQNTTPPTITDEGPSGLKGLADRAWNRRARAADALLESQFGDRETLQLTSIRSDAPTGPNIGRLEDDLLPPGLLRLLPLKHTLRLIWTMTGARKDSVPDGELREVVSNMLELNGERLSREDDRDGRGRGERLSTGFSHLDDTARNRTISWIIGSGQGSSKRSAMEIVGWTTKDATGHRLTPHGLDLARLPNPVIDQEEGNRGAFSTLERGLILTSINHRLPLEWKIMRTLIDGMRDGPVGNERLDSRMIRRFGESTDYKWSDSTLQIRRVAAVTRMCELGLVIRQRDGRKSVTSLVDNIDEILRLSESDNE